MSAPLYFLPKVMLSGLAPGGKLNRSLLASRGLGHLSDIETTNDMAYCEICGKGPSSDPGIVISPLPIATREPPRRLGYYPEDQRWTRINDSLYLGIDPAFPPTPADLARKAIFSGYQIKLGDGQLWEIPVLREFSSRTPLLPQDMFLDEYGHFALQLREEYAELWKVTERVARLFYEPKSPDYGSMPLDEALSISLAAIGLNYRVGHAENRVLRLVNSENWESILGAMVQWPLVKTYLEREEEALKKNAASSGPGTNSTSSTPGGSDSVPIIVPDAANFNS